MGCALFEYLQKIAKTWNIQGLISDNILEDIIESKNHIIMIDVSLIKFRDKENGGSPSRLLGSVYLSQKNYESKRAKCWCSKEKYEKNSANYRKCKKNWHFPQGKSLRLYFTIWVFRVQKFLWLLPEVPILSWIPVDGGQIKSCALEMCTWSQVAVSKMLQTKIEGKGSSITEKLQMHLLT